MSKVNIFQLKKQLDRIHELILGAQEDTFYEPLEHIKDEDKGERVFRYKGVYYTKDNIKILHDAIVRNEGYENQLKAFREMTTNLSRNKELWSLGIQPEHIKYVDKFKLYVCTDGKLLYKNLTPYKHTNQHSTITLQKNGQTYKFNRGLTVYNYFVDRGCDKVWFRSTNYSDCRVDNLFDASELVED